MSPVTIRYIVEDVEAAIDFYTTALGFDVEMNPAPGFAALKRGELTLLLNAPGAGGAGQATPDGRRPESGGWNRFQLTVANLDGKIDALCERGHTFRNELVEGTGGKQILLEDPSGNVVELFEPSNAEQPVGDSDE